MKKRTFLSALMGVFIVLWMTVGSGAGAANFHRQGGLAATLSEVEGDVQARDSETGQFTPAKAGQVLPVLGQVQTGVDGRARLDLSSGTIIRIAPSSLFTFESNESSSGGLLTSLSVELGKIWVVLKGGKLDVSTPAGVASVQGSYLNVNVEKRADGTYSITAQCFEGNCSLGNGTGEPVPLVTGQVAEFSYNPATGEVSEPETRPMTDAEVQEWLANSPEAQDVLEFVLDAIAQLQDQEPGTVVTGTVSALPSSGSGSFALNPQFSLGAAQVSITDPLVGVVTAAVIKQSRFVVSQTEDNLVLLSHGISIDMDNAGYVQVCFAYPPVKSDFSVVRWDSSGRTGSLPGQWKNMDTYRQGPTLCSKVPVGTFALAGL